MRNPLSKSLDARKDATSVCIVIPMSEIKKFILIDFIASTVIYYALKIPSHSIIAAMAGSFAGPILIRQTLKLNSGSKSKRLFRSSRR